MANDNIELLNEFNLKKAKNDFRRFSNAFNKITNKQKYISLNKLITRIDSNIDILSNVIEKEKVFKGDKVKYLNDGKTTINTFFNNDLKDVYDFYKSLLTKNEFLKLFTPKKNIKLKSGGDVYFTNEFGDFKIGTVKKQNNNTYLLTDFNGNEYKFKSTEFMDFIKNYVFENYILFSNTDYLDEVLKLYLSNVSEYMDKITSEIDNKYLSKLLEVSIGKRLAVQMLRGYNTVYKTLTTAAKNIKNKGDIAKLLNNVKKTHQNSIKKLELYLDTTEKHLKKKKYSANQKYINSVRILKNSKKNNSWKNSYKY